MKPKNRGLSALLLAISLVSLSACEREAYTSWNCKNNAGEKKSMVLKKAQMQFQGGLFNYCGSLGEKSYFDSNCPPLIQKAKITFIPSTGALLHQEQELHCEALWTHHPMVSNPINPKKLLLTKWTAVQPLSKEKHFLVSKVILPEIPDQVIEFVELEAIYSKKTRTIPWRALEKSEVWIQGWK